MNGYAGILKLRKFSKENIKFGEFFCTLCGNTKTLMIKSVLRGRIETCGCVRNMSEHVSWEKMKNRCYNSNHDQYNRYGGRGINICDRWRASFIYFYNDMGPKPSKEYTIERKDNNKDYCKNNCYWATRKQQANNRITSTQYKYNDKIKTLAEWCNIYNLNYFSIKSRLNKGKSIKEAIEKPF